MPGNPTLKHMSKTNTTTSTAFKDDARRILNDRSLKSPNGCIIWTGPKNRLGYGKVSVHARSFRAHRLAFFLATETWPEMVLHRCDNPPCCNPDHLFAGDHTLNMRDASLKGRLGMAERHCMSKLSNAQVIEIRSQYATGKFTLRKMARMFGVQDSAISDIVLFKTWKSVKATGGQPLDSGQPTARNASTQTLTASTQQ